MDVLDFGCGTGIVTLRLQPYVRCIAGGDSSKGILFRRWHQVVKPAGQVCFAVLYKEDRSFHSDNTGVFHFGFDREELKKQLQESGFRDVRDMTVATVVRDVAGAGKKEFSIFLIEGQK